MTETISKQNKRRRRAKRDISQNITTSPGLGKFWVKDTLLKAVWFPKTKDKFNKLVDQLMKEKRTFTTSKN